MIEIRNKKKYRLCSHLFLRTTLNQLKNSKKKGIDEKKPTFSTEQCQNRTQLLVKSIL